MTSADNPRVLLVDDKPEILTTLTRFLALKGYSVEVATSIAEATPLLEQRSFQAVVLYLRLGPDSGLDLLKFIREHEALRELPAVMLTGASLTREEQTAVARFKAHVFFKPRSYEALTTYLDRVTRKQ